MIKLPATTAFFHRTSLALGLAGLLACTTTEYQTATPYCVTGTVVDMKSEKYINDVGLGTGPEYSTRLVREVKLDIQPNNGRKLGKTIYLHGFGPDEGDHVNVCVHAPIDYAVRQDHFFPAMQDPDEIIHKVIYNVTAEILPKLPGEN